MVGRLATESNRLTALKTLTLRLRGSKTELEEMGEDVSDMATTTSQLQAKLLALTGGKVDIMLDANTFKNSTQILREMADAWEDMNDIQRASALELMGGKRQANVLSALIQNFDTVEKVIETSQKSAGSALKENEKYLDSIQGRIDQFNNALQSMWNNVLDDDLIKFIVQAGTELLKLVDNLGLVKTLVIGIGTYLIQKNFKGDLWGGLFNVNSIEEARGRLEGLQKEIDKLQGKKLAPFKNTRIQKKQDRYNSLDKTIKEYDELSKKVQQLREESEIAQKAFEQENERLAQKAADALKAQDASLDATEAEKKNLDALKAKYDDSVIAVQQNEEALRKVETQAYATGAAGLNAGNKIKTGFVNGAKAVWKFSKEMAMSMAYTMAITAVFEALGNIWDGLKPLFDRMVETPEELQEKLTELQNELSSVESELSSLQSELESTDERIEELMDQGSLTFVEQEELNKLKSVSNELKSQIALQETLQKSLQQSTNSASVQATNAYLDTSFMSEKSKTERQEEAEEMGSAIGQVAGTIIGGIIGTAIGGLITVGSAGTAAVPGAAIGISVGSAVAGWIGGEIGSSMAGSSYDSEQTVGEAMDSMLETRAKLKEEQNKALADQDTKAYNEATEALATYDKQMATHISQIQQNYNAMDWDSISPEDEEMRKQMMEYADWLDKYNISMGTSGAKNNAIARIFGDEASEELKNIKAKIEEAVNAGESFVLKDILTEEEYQAVLSRLSGIGIGIGDVTAYFEDAYKSEVEAMNDTSTESAVKEVANLTSGVKALKDAFNELRTEGKVSFDTLIDLKDVFGDLDSWSNFITIMSTGTATMGQMTEQAKILAEEFVATKISPTGLINPDEYLTYINGLESLGITNAKEFFDAKLQQAAAEAFVNGTYATIEEAEKAFSSENNQVDISEELVSAAQAKKAADDAKKAAIENDATYQALKTTVGNALGAVDEAKRKRDDADLIRELEKLGFSQDDLSRLSKDGDAYVYKAQNGNVFDWSGNPYVRQYVDAKNEVKEATRAYAEALVALSKAEEADVPNAEKVASEAAADYQKALDKIGLVLDIQLVDANDLIDDLQSVYDSLSSAAKEYAENGGYVSVDTLQTLLGLEPKYLGLLYNEQGQLELNTESIQRMTQARIMEMAILQAKSYLTDLENAAMDNNVEKLTALTEATYIATEAEWGFVDSQLASIKTKMMDKGMSEAEATDYIENARHNIESMKKLAETTAANIGNTISSSGNTAAGEVADAFQDLMDYYDNRIEANQSKYDQIQNDIDWLESQGKMADANYYRDQIDLLTASEESKEALLKAKLQGATDRLKELEDAGKEGSDEWWEAAKIYNDTLSELDDVRDTVIDLQDAIGEIEWSKFEELNNRLDDTNSKLETMRDLIAPNGEEDWFDDEGNWTEKGVAVLGSYVQSLEYYKNGLSEATDALDDFNEKSSYEGNEQWYADNYGIHSEQEYYDYLQKLTDEQYKYASSVSDTEQDIAGMWESQVDAVEDYMNSLVEAYSDYIDNVKEALDAERDLYDFKKRIQKQTKDISTLERRIASLSGSTNAADIAERRKLEAELYESRESLNDEYNEHSRQSQQDALDAESQAYEDAMNKFVENLRENLDLALQDMGTFIEGVTSAVTVNAPTILGVYESLGVALDSAIVDPWQAAIDAMGEDGYSGEEGLGLMNSWVAKGGVFDTFATDATDYLTSIWDDTNVDPGDAFANAVGDVVEGIVSNIASNVETARTYLTDLYSIRDTTANYTGGGSGGGGGGGNTTTTETATAYLRTSRGLLSATGNGATVSAAQAAAKTAVIQKAYDAFKGDHDDAQLEAFYDEWWKNVVFTKPTGSSTSTLTKGISSKLTSYAYAKGTTGTSRDQWAITDEPWLGDELVLVPGKDGNLSYMRKGTGVVPADLTANLMEWGQFTPDSLNLGGGVNINMINNAVNKPEFNFAFDALVKAENITEETLPAVKKLVTQELNRFTKELNYALKGKGAR